MCFAGGVAGLYTFKNSSDGGTLAASLQALLTSLKSDNGYKNAEQTYQTVAGNDLTDSSLFRKAAPSISVELDFAGKGNSAAVSAGLFAGGLFGYTPDKQNLTIKYFVNSGNILTTGSVAAVTESADSSIKYSYLGGVVGRVSRGMTLKSCRNDAKGIYLEGASEPDSFYYARKASWMGSLTEVNAGCITTASEGTDSIELALNTSAKHMYIEGNNNVLMHVDDMPVLDYSTASGLKGLGGFAGVNGTTITDGETTGVISYCSNQCVLKSADSVGGIAAAIGGPSAIVNCENRGTLSSGSAGLAGGIAGTALNGVAGDIYFTSCVNLGEIENCNAAAGIVYDTKEMGEITYCRDYGKGAQFGITGTKAKRVYANMEAGGLHRGEEGKAPIARDADDAGLIRNFFIYGIAGGSTVVDDDNEEGWPVHLYNRQIEEINIFDYKIGGEFTYSIGSLVTPILDGNQDVRELIEGLDDNTPQNRLILYKKLDKDLLSLLQSEEIYPNQRFVQAD